MGRKKVPAKVASDRYVKCSCCGRKVHKNEPANGIVYSIGGKKSGLCRQCGTMLIQVLGIAEQRWG